MVALPAPPVGDRPKAAGCRLLHASAQPGATLSPGQKRHALQGGRSRPPWSRFGLAVDTGRREKDRQMKHEDTSIRWFDRLPGATSRTVWRQRMPLLARWCRPSHPPESLSRRGSRRHATLLPGSSSTAVTSAPRSPHCSPIGTRGVPRLPRPRGMSSEPDPPLHLACSTSPRQIARAYAALCKRAGKDNVAVAVRSSATAEDLPDASFAGRPETFLQHTWRKRPDDRLPAVLCLALHRPRYRLPERPRGSTT